MRLRDGRRTLPRLLQLALALGLAAPAALEAQGFRAVLVHGDGVPTPFLVEDEDAARCLWVFTYQFYETREGRPPADPAGVVTLSFLSEERLHEVREALPDPPAVDSSGFHTRLLLRPDGTLPHTQFRKPGHHRFSSRIRLHPDAEPYLASKGIPTRVRTDASPRVIELSEEERERAEAVLDESLGGGFPRCGRIAAAGPALIPFPR